MSTNSDAITEFISKEFLNGASRPDEDTNLIESDIIDSLGIFTLVSFIEGHFDIKVEPDEVTIENFESVDAVTRLVESKL